MKNKLLLIGWTIFALSSSSFAATVAIPAGTYTENFNILSRGTEPTAGWDLRTGASATSIGSFTKRRILNVFSWDNTGGTFKEVSSNNIPQTSDAAAQAANPNRALGLNQSFTLGNPGATFNFNFSSTGVLLDSISIDLLLLFDVANSTTWSLGYGIGANPTSFTSMATWSDLSIPSGWGNTTFTFDRDDFGSDLDDQSQVWFRVFAATTVDPNSSAANVFDSVAIDNFSVTASAIPEPSVLFLGCLGVLGFLGARSR